MFQTLYIYIWRSKGTNVKAASSVAPGDADIEQIKTGSLSVLRVQTSEEECLIQQVNLNGDKLAWSPLPLIEPVVKHSPPTEIKKATRKRKIKAPEAQELPVASEEPKPDLPKPESEKVPQEAQKEEEQPDPDPKPSEPEETEPKDAPIVDLDETKEEEFQDEDNAGDDFEEEGEEEKDNEFEFDTPTDSDSEEMDLDSDNENDDESIEEPAPETTRKRSSLRSRFTRSKRIEDGIKSDE